MALKRGAERLPPWFQRDALFNLCTAGAPTAGSGGGTSYAPAWPTKHQLEQEVLGDHGIQEGALAYLRRYDWDTTPRRHALHTLGAVAKVLLNVEPQGDVKPTASGLFIPGDYPGLMRLSVLARYGEGGCPAHLTTETPRRLPGIALKFPVRGGPSLNLHLSHIGDHPLPWDDLLTLPLRTWLANPSQIPVPPAPPELHQAVTNQKRLAVALFKQFEEATRRVRPDGSLPVLHMSLDEARFTHPFAEPPRQEEGQQIPRFLELRFTDEFQRRWRAARPDQDGAPDGVRVRLRRISEEDGPTPDRYELAEVYWYARKPNDYSFAAPPTDGGQRKRGVPSTGGPHRLGSIFVDESAWVSTQFVDEQLNFAHALPHPGAAPSGSRQEP